MTSSLSRMLPTFAVLALAPGLVIPSQASAQGPVAVRDTLLDNGLQVIVIPDGSVPVATLEIVVRAGAFTQVEPPDEGLPHLLEHMLFKVYDNGSGFGGDAVDVGAAYNGTTGDERVTYYLTLPSGRVEDGIELLARLVRDPDFSRQALDDERFVVRGELERMVSDPYQVMNMISDMALWGDAFRRKNGIGNVETIMAADVDRLQAHYEQFYVPNNAALIVSGPVDVEDVFEWAEDRFEEWETNRDPFVDFSPPAVELLAGDTAFVVPVASTDITFSVKWQGPSMADDPTAALAADVFSEIFNLPTSGAQRRLVDSGQFQTASMGYRTLNHVGPISLTARTTPERLARAITELGVELGLLDDPGYFTEEDLEAAKRSLRVRNAIQRESVASLAHTVADYWAVAGLDSYRSYETDLEAITLDDIREYVDRYLVDRPKVVAAIATEELMQPLHDVIGAAVDGWSQFQ